MTMRPDDAIAFMRAMEARFACKLFDVQADVLREEEDFILETGRLTPTSFGLEHWLFASIRDSAARERLVHACFGQEGVRTAPLIIALLVRHERDYQPNAAFVRARAERFPGGYPEFLADYQGYYEHLSANALLAHWARAQSYLACANMMTAAASLGLDSCAIEGFKDDEVLEILASASKEFDPETWRVGILLTVGRRGQPVRQRVRAALQELVLRI